MLVTILNIVLIALSVFLLIRRLYFNWVANQPITDPLTRAREIYRDYQDDGRSRFFGQHVYLHPDVYHYPSDWMRLINELERLLPDKRISWKRCSLLITGGRDIRSVDISYGK